MRATFLDMFNKKRIKSAKSYSLTKEFKTEIQTLIVKKIIIFLKGTLLNG